MRLYLIYLKIWEIELRRLNKAMAFYFLYKAIDDDNGTGTGPLRFQMKNTMAFYPF